MAESMNDASGMEEPSLGEPDSNSEAMEPSEDTTVESDSEPDLPLDQVFEILRNQRRRHVLRFLNDSDGTISLGELSERIAALENEKDVNEISSSERKRVYVGLYQCHLPKMDGMDVISFNKPRGIISPGTNLDLFSEYMEDEVEGPAQWPLYYASLSGVGLLVLLGAVGVRSVVDLPVMEFAASAVTIAIFILSIIHLFRTRRADDDR